MTDMRPKLTLTERATVLMVLRDRRAVEAAMPFRVLARYAANGRLVRDGRSDAAPSSWKLVTLGKLDRGMARRALQSCVDLGLVETCKVPRWGISRWSGEKRPMRVYWLSDLGVLWLPEEALRAFDGEVLDAPDGVACGLCEMPFEVGEPMRACRDTWRHEECLIA